MSPPCLLCLDCLILCTCPQPLLSRYCLMSYTCVSPLYIVSVFHLSPVGLSSIVPCPFPVVLSVFLVLPVDPACPELGFSACPFWTLFFCKLFCLIKECFLFIYLYCVQPVSLRLSLTPSQEPDTDILVHARKTCPLDTGVSV